MGLKKNLPLEMQVKVCVDSNTDLHLDRLAKTAGRDKQAVIRAALAVAIPFLERNPAMIQLLQPDILFARD